MNLVAFDLDDTLYKEEDYLLSAYRHIERQAGIKCYEDMLEAYRNGKDAFSLVVEKSGGRISKPQLLSWYRFHKPDIVLSDGAEECLQWLKAGGHIIALITDGRSITQRNKIHALSLEKFIEGKDIVISEEIGSEKPSGRNYQCLAQLHPSADRYIYVGDNLKKDFLAANRLGWDTVCMLDDGRNIHPQNFTGKEGESLPKQKVRDFEELQTYLMNKNEKMRER